MTKKEVLDRLAEKLEANRAVVRDLLEQLCEAPGASVTNEQHGDLLQKMSVVWKEGRALQEVAAELVGLVYPDEPPPETQPVQVLQ